MSDAAAGRRRYELHTTDLFVHLTNVAIQKTSEDYDESTGGKWLLRDLKLYMMSRWRAWPAARRTASLTQRARQVWRGANGPGVL